MEWYMACVLLTVFVLLAIYWLREEPSGLPPGPRGFPLAGHFPSLAAGPVEAMKKWKAEYGPIYRLYFAQELVIVLNTFEIVKEAMVKQGDVFSGRPIFFLSEQIQRGKRLGLANIDGERWKDQRRFTLQVMRNLGMGRNLLVGKIDHGIGDFLDEIERLRKKDSDSVDYKLPLKLCVINIIGDVALGKRFERDEPRFIQYQEIIEDNFKILAKAIIVNYFPWIRYVIPGGLGLYKLIKNADILGDYMKELIQEHRQEIEKNDPTGEPTDLTEAYCREVDRLRELGATDHYFDDGDQLATLLGEVFAAGLDTTVITLSWIFALLCHHPEVQERCFTEIDQLGRIPSWEDRTKVPYLQAVIYEGQRIGCITPQGLPHATLENTKLAGYSIPKGSTVIMDLKSIFDDPVTFPHPELFRPDRFIGPDGQLKPIEALIPFSIGKRSCLGEGMAKMELFMILAAVLFTYTFEGEHGKLPDLRKREGINSAPRDFNLRLVKRQK